VTRDSVRVLSDASCRMKRCRFADNRNSLPGTALDQTKIPICSPGGNDNGTHGLYLVNGMTGQAADFAARRLSSSGVPA
jgi:hypothetical protein